MGPNTQKDASWIRRSFFMSTTPDSALDNRRFFSTAYVKFTDTTAGGNFAINSPAQFTRFCDIRDVSRSAANKPDLSGLGGLGMGRYYSEAIDDSSQVINLRMGQPRFNSMFAFFTGFYNGSAGLLARTGRATGVFYNLGRAAGFVVPLLSWKLLAVSSIGNGIKFMMDKPQTKYYYSKPNMPLYWHTVQTMVNRLSVNMGIVPRLGGEDQAKLNPGYQFTPAALEKMADLLPEIFRRKGGVDVYAMGTRAQRLAQQQRDAFEAEANSNTNGSVADMVTNVLSKPGGGTNPSGKMDYFDYMQSWLKSDASKPKGEDTNSDVNTESIEYGADKVTQVPVAGWSDFGKAELNEGGAFASFRVNSTGPMSESFSSSFADSALKEKINSISSSSRAMQFNLSGGNIGSDILGSVVNAVKDFAAGVADTIQISGIAALGGSALVDLPKHWESSSASLPRSTYTINLTSPYGNPISQLINIYVPLCMLMACALPLSTGPQSYTSPFLVELFDQGRAQSRLAMFESLQITRGVGNLGFNKEGRALAIDVSFTIVDMTDIMHIPISEGFTFGKLAKGVAGAVTGAVGGGSLGALGVGISTVAGGAAAAAAGGGVVSTAAGAAAGAASGTFGAAVVGGAFGWASATGLFSDDTAYSDYMAVLAGQDLFDQIYPWPKLKLRLTEQMLGIDQLTNKSRITSWLADTPIPRLMGAFYRGTDRQ